MDYVAALKARHATARPLTIAHRAGNELGLLPLAEAAGVDLVETDVWLHRGRLEVRHLKTLGPVPILWDRWRLAAAWTPRLQLVELLAAVRPETMLLLDLKGRNPRLPDLLLDAVRRSGAEDRVVACSQTWPFLDALRQHLGTPVVYSIGKPRQLAAIWPRLAPLDYPAVSIHERLLDPSTVRAFKERATSIITWPINDERRKDELVALGVDGIISDDLELLRRVVRGADHGLGRRSFASGTGRPP